MTFFRGTIPHMQEMSESTMRVLELAEQRMAEAVAKVNQHN